MQCCASSHKLISCKGNCKNQKYCNCLQIYMSSKKPSCEYEISDFDGNTAYKFVKDKNQHHKICYCNGFRIYRYVCCGGEEMLVERCHRMLMDNFRYGTKSDVFDLNDEKVINELFDLLCDLIICYIYINELKFVNKIFDYEYFFETVKRHIKEKEKERNISHHIINFINESVDMFDTSLCIVPVETINVMKLLDNYENKLKKFIGDKMIEKLKISNAQFDVLLIGIINAIKHPYIFAVFRK